MRELFKCFNKNCSTTVVPEEYLCIDETLYLTRNKSSFKQCNPSKPAKYGLLFKSTNAFTYAYKHHIIPCCGKPNEEATAYYVKEVEETEKYLVQNFQNHSTLICKGAIFSLTACTQVYLRCNGFFLKT